jgi:cellobiose phosphorylase
MRTVVEGLLGIAREYGGFRFKPAFPSKWKEASVTLKRNGAVYEIKITRGRRPGVKLNGIEMAGNFVPFQGPGKHRVEVVV